MIINIWGFGHVLEHAHLAADEHVIILELEKLLSTLSRAALWELTFTWEAPGWPYRMPACGDTSRPVSKWLLIPSGRQLCRTLHCNPLGPSTSSSKSDTQRAPQTVHEPCRWQFWWLQDPLSPVFMFQTPLLALMLCAECWWETNVFPLFPISWC